MVQEPSIGAVTIFDVAREAGVSYSTVSRVVNNYSFVKSGTRERVLMAMDKLGYVANASARQLAGGKSMMIGLLVYDLESSYLVELVKGIDSELSELNYDLMLSTTHQRRAKEASFVSRLTHGMVDGLLLVLPSNLDGYLPSLVQQDFPFVLIDYVDPTKICNTISVTNWRGSFEATTYLIGLGHRRIGFIMGRLDVYSTHQRLAGYQSALLQYDLPQDPSLIVIGDFREYEGYTCTKTLLELREAPTAILASCDAAAFGAMRAIYERGLRIPEDISIIGFDDIPQAATTQPALTTVRVPLRSMSHIATRLLLAKIASNNHMPQQIELPTELVIRQSCTLRRTLD